MRILIISDMEGISGIVRSEQVLAGKPMFEDPGKPCEIVVEFQNTSAWEEFRQRTGVEDAGERRIKCTGPDWWTAWTIFFRQAVYGPSS